MSAPLVVVFLRGGADGLSLLVPLGDGNYVDKRGALAIEEDRLLAVDASFGFHPALAKLHARFVRGEVATVPAIGVPDMSRSHFDAQFRIETAASASGTPPETGWLGRHLAAGAGETINPLRGVSFGQVGLPQILAGSQECIAATSLAGLGLGGRRGDDAALAELMQLYGDLLDEMWADAEGSRLRDSALAGLGAVGTAAAIEAPSPEGREVAAGLTDTVAVLNAGVGTEVAVLNIGGWDTHTNQGVLDGAFAGLVGNLDAVVDTVLTSVPGSVVAVITEFGRRVAPNSSGGCDHGRGGVALVAGAGVAGGLKGEWPGLGSLDEGDVPTANDLRVLMAEVITHVLGGNPSVAVGEVPEGSLGLFA